MQYDKEIALAIKMANNKRHFVLCEVRAEAEGKLTTYSYQSSNIGSKPAEQSQQLVRN